MDYNFKIPGFKIRFPEPEFFFPVNRYSGKKIRVREIDFPGKNSGIIIE